MIEENFIRLGQDFYLDKDDIGSVISVIIEYDYYNTLSRFDNCLLVGLFNIDGVRAKGITVFYEGKLKYIKLSKLKNIKIKFIT
jgi:hypothetical protein